jgi:hypothetical protein
MSEKVNLVFYLMANCDLSNGRITDMTKDKIEDMWVEEDLNEIILLGQTTCSEFRRAK